MYPSLQCGGDAKREASRLWCSILGCFVKRVLHSLGWTLTVTALHFLNLPSLFRALSVWDMSLELRLCSLCPVLYPIFLFSLKLSLARAGFLHLLSVLLCPLHISLGLVPLIKHSCRARRKAPLLSHCYINWLAVFLRPWPCWFRVTSITVVYALDTELILLSPLTALTQVIQPIHKCVCVHVYSSMHQEGVLVKLK